MKLTHLCFADDLLVLCHGSEESVIAIKEALDLFSKVSCLKPNMNKSTIYFSNVDIGEKCRILNIMPFQVGSFPTRYLGVPLISKRLGKTKRKQLVDKVKSKVGDWKNKFLSYAGRDIERILKGFLWNQGDVVRGKAAWKTIYKPKIKGGLGFKDLGSWNKERNKRQFTNERRNVNDLSRIILDTVKLKLSSIKVIKTVFVESVEKEWGVKLNNQMRERLGNVVMELWSGAKWVFALG
ncbi:hypothetical protein Tco_0844280 [Tanacetum coccineum]